MDPQPLLTRRPIICTRCMHGHAVDVIPGRENTPTEYHCVFCGNYAIVGKPARWPFMEVIKDTTRPEEKKATPDHNDTGSSPMQVGESLKPKKEEKSMQPKCFTEGCDKPAQAVGLCDLHFHDRFGITVAEYRENKQHRTESVASVVARLKGEPRVRVKPEAIEKAVAEGRITPEKGKRLLNELKPAPPPEPPKPEPLRVEVQQPEPSCTVVIDPELLDRLAARAKGLYRTPDQQASYYISRGLRRDGA